MTDTTKGILAMITACLSWGLSPIVFKALTGVPPIEVLAHRTFWSVVMFVLLLALKGQMRSLFAAFNKATDMLLLMAASILLFGNWYLFIWAIQTGYATQTALGFYIFPLVAVIIGRVFFAEILSTAQWIAVFLATAAVCLLTYVAGAMPWISLILAICFGIYGMIKKRLTVPATVSVTAEMLILLPVALFILWQSSHNGVAHFGGWDQVTVLLIFSGPLTAVPMILFSYATAKLTMTSVGLISYINPTLQFFCAVALFSEPFTHWHFSVFSLIWLALGLYSYASWRHESTRRKAAKVPAALGTSVM